MTGAAKRIALEIVGWTLLLTGIAALFLPGPGLLCIFGGLALLSQQYDWAERRVEPVRLRALRGAAESVESWLRIFFTVGGIVTLAACGVLWILGPPAPLWWPQSDPWLWPFGPPAPHWWPLSGSWWLPGGIWVGGTQVASAVFAFALLVYAYRRFHGKPEAVDALERDIEDADTEAHR